MNCILNKCYNHPEEKPFAAEFHKKLVVLLGKNGDGKTTMLKSIEQQFKDEEHVVINDDLARKGDSIENIYNMNHIAQTRFSSEGECLYYTVGLVAEKIGRAVASGKKVIVCLDKLDSGLSYDRILDVADFIYSMLESGPEMIFVSANSYELASQFVDLAEYYWVKEKKTISFPGNYSDYIALYSEVAAKKRDERLMEEQRSEQLRIEAIKILRNATGAGQLACKTALVEANWNLEEAFKLIQKR